MKKRLQFAVAVMMAISATGAAVASELPGAPGEIANWLPGYAGKAASPLIRVQMTNQDRCVMSCKNRYAICREGRGRRNNNVCVRELNECVPGC